MLGLLAAVVSDPQVAVRLDDPRLTETRAAEMLIEICGEHLDGAGRNFVRVLADNRRIGVLPEMYLIYEQLRQDAEGVVEAEVVSALPVTDEQRDRITNALKRRLGRDVTLNCSTDSSLLGGAVIRAGDLVIDGSVAGKVKRLGSTLGH